METALIFCTVLRKLTFDSCTYQGSKLAFCLTLKTYLPQKHSVFCSRYLKFEVRNRDAIFDAKFDSHSQATKFSALPVHRVRCPPLAAALLSNSSRYCRGSCFANPVLAICR
uniref:(northern house mosquito) hypothetical protein n=1 Tax=Culex pipiens TaxID=7175 RepID=A0A8D8B3X6_CULPI